jgi:signal peptidase I
MPEKRSAARGRWWREWVRPLMITGLVVGCFRSAAADWNDVPSGSMEPTILVGDRVFVNKLAYDLKLPFTTWHLAEWAQPRRGDIVVFFSPYDGRRLVKRVVGLPGDRLELREDHLLLNGVPARYRPLIGGTVSPPPAARLLEESLGGRSHAMRVDASPVPQASFGPVVVPQGQYFMMGDCRDNSFDSRFFGSVPRSRIVGRATGVVASVDIDRHFAPRWGRFFTAMR